MYQAHIFMSQLLRPKVRLELISQKMHKTPGPLQSTLFNTPSVATFLPSTKHSDSLKTGADGYM